MKSQFVKTSNALKFMGALDSLNRRGAGEACLMVVDGVPGLGKSAVLEWWAVQTNSVFIRAKAKWSAPWALRELLSEMHVTPEHSFEAMFRQVIGAVAARAREAERDKSTFGIVIDEVDHIVGSKMLLESFRDISDFVEIPLIFVGMGRVRHRLTRFTQIASRVGQYVEFTPAPIADVRALVDGLCEVKVRDDLVEFLHRVSQGRSREVKEGIASIERFGKRNRGAEVGLSDMVGEVLLNDRDSGKPIVVRS